MLTPRIMKLRRYIDHDWQMTPIDFQVFRRKKLVIRLANAGGLAGWLAGGLAGWLAGWRNKLVRAITMSFIVRF
ncbi:hypothetical protein DPMN_085104 [Dreissena polymorpha]|uniref:Uncharacterized protein n=1 Tax=Dreissena polymorpha TaxID=45954 RepID=A0A9D3YF26_DREPO|nr:hypothetical protein DPMN_085104 [Dreissena polymorpha]